MAAIAWCDRVYVLAAEHRSDATGIMVTSEKTLPSGWREKDRSVADLFVYAEWHAGRKQAQNSRLKPSQATLLLIKASVMQKQRASWRADRGSRAIKRIAEIEASIAALTDDDLLDLADIFVAAPQSGLGDIASAEMARRNIRL